MEMLGFQVGSLPVRYLGLPLFSTRLKKEHCSALITKITARILNWTAKSLSYAGRLQLVQSMLTSIHLYWSSMFLLPKVVVHEVEHICKSFFMAWH